LDIIMVNYRLYFLTNVRGHIDRFEPITANGDEAAIAAAACHQCEWPMELWWRGRKVHSFAAC
jgi:hypothetical protein